VCNGDGIELMLNYLRSELEVFLNPKDQSQDQTGDFMKLIKTEIEDSFWNWELNNIDLYIGKGWWVVLIVGSL